MRQPDFMLDYDLPVFGYEQLDSTNGFARENFEELPDGALVLAMHQTAGRGRRERVWISPPGTNLALTWVDKRPGAGYSTGMLLGLAGLAALRSAAPELECYIKWPNDLYIRHRKIAGILCEGAGFSGTELRGVAGGIGMNINTSGEALASVGDTATGLFLETGRHFDLKKIVFDLAKYLKWCYISKIAENGEATRLYRAENRLIGKEIALIDGRGNRYEGTFEELGPGGELLLRRKSGALESFCCADVSVDKKIFNS
ncbi:MAG: biotin--[acetyl-CoA-carboxylase] ligase [Victivallaceae bacterium]|nr:biotin--[acetyl-CoA-carboxylase] ligase [Victivallaceae bacterium]